MATQIFVNLPVKDLSKSVAFFTVLGFSFNAKFSNESGACMIVDDNIYVMLLVEPFFKQFTKKQIANAKKTTEVLVCLSADSRNKVDKMVHRALEAGGRESTEKQDHGWMYQHGFEDLDGHLWEVAHMDETKLEE